MLGERLAVRRDHLGACFHAAAGERDIRFDDDIAFAGAFRISNVPQDSLHPVVMIECPRLLFPFAREIIATTVQNGGFPPLYLNMVDFAAIYQQQAQANTGGAPGGTAPGGKIIMPS